MSARYVLLGLALTLPFALISQGAEARQAVSEPIGGPYGTWCTAIGPGVGQQDICGISSPEAACAVAVKIAYPQDLDALLPVINEGSRTQCDTNASLIRSRGRLWIGDPGIRQDCATDTLSGNQCTPIPKQPPENCSPGGINHRSGNPIDAEVRIFSEDLQLASCEIWLTEDGFASFSLGCMSRIQLRLGIQPTCIKFLVGFEPMALHSEEVLSLLNFAGSGSFAVSYFNFPMLRPIVSGFFPSDWGNLEPHIYKKISKKRIRTTRPQFQSVL